MIIWSIQTERAWKNLQREGRLIAHAHHQADNWPEAYRWITGQLSKRIGPSPVNEAAPLWGWYQWMDEKNKRPDLRSVRHHWAPPDNYVLLECDLPDDQVLLSDFDAWHIVLNNGYMPLDEKSDDIFHQKLEQAGWKSGQPKPKNFLHEIRKSWDHIFDLDAMKGPYWNDTPQKSIQACFWEIPLHKVKSIRPFTTLK